jgi:proteasome assembly chaperone (PAC2) family protein
MDSDGALVEHARPKLRSPILIAAFRGWNDAGDAATLAATHIGRMWAAEKMASIDPEEFYDFQAVRPQVELVDGVTRKITWPANEFWSAELEGNRDVIVVVGTEPSHRWRTFSRLILDVAERHGVELLVTFGALLADVPHSRPVSITATGADAELVKSLDLVRSRYEGPTGIVGVLHDTFGKAGIASASLWAAVPHYLSVTPNPKAALALVQKASQLIGIPVATAELERATNDYEESVAEMVAGDEDVQAYVHVLEERADERDVEDDDPIDPANLPSGDALAAELETFLRERTDGTD